VDPNAFTWLLLIAMHPAAGPAQACCATQAQIEVPAFDVPSCDKKAAGDAACSIPAYVICKAIADANKDAAASITCIAKPK
jgi:hypothetical protein